MEVTERDDGVTVVNDAYNANPESMRAALEALAAMSAGRRSWAVLGEMLELGAASTARARGGGQTGPQARASRGWSPWARVPGRSTRERWPPVPPTERSRVLVPDVDAAVALLEAQLRPGDVVLVKASRGAGPASRVADALLADGGDAS